MKARGFDRDFAAKGGDPTGIAGALYSRRPMLTEITTWHLEMLSPADLRPSGAEVPGLEIRQARIPSPELNRFLYTAVGGDWFWIDRLGWSYERWLRYLDRPELETWVASVEGTPAGY